MKTIILTTIGLLLIVVGTALPLLLIEGDYFKYIYATGALLLFVGRLMAPVVPKTWPLRLRRMIRLETWSAIIFIVAVVMMFMPPTLVGARDWIAFTMAGGIIQAYTSIMIPRMQRKYREQTNEGADS